MKTVDKILETALRLFNEEGYIQVGVREISRELDISPGNLSYHFPKKEDILFRLLQDFSQANNQFYEGYFSGPATNEHLLGLMKNIFHSQFKYRGVYIGNQFVQQELQNQDRFNYQAVAGRREEIFRKIFEGLSHAGQLKLDDSDIGFLVSYISLFGRFWISEALLFDRHRGERETIGHYLNLLARQLSLFSTAEGMLSIERFKAHNLQ